MDRLRPRQRKIFSGFTSEELVKLEKLYNEFEEQTLDREFCQRAARAFSRSVGRTGKPVVKWEEVQSWFQDRLQQQEYPSKASRLPSQPEEIAPSLAASREAEEKTPDLSELEFEAKSRDGAWYDVDRFLTHRYHSSGEAEVLTRFIGFSAEDDEWVNIKKCVRERSIPLEHWECDKVKVGDIVLCFQERKDQAIYYDARVMDVQRKMHDIRGCRCIFFVRYEHDGTEEQVRLRRLCRILVPNASAS